MVLSVMSQWFGSSTTTEPAPAPRALTIRPVSEEPAPRLRKTKSDEFLRDFESMRFLAACDARLTVDRATLDPDDASRLEALYAQALADDCTPLLDIVEHLETEFRALRYASCAPSTSSAPILAAGRP